MWLYTDKYSYICTLWTLRRNLSAEMDSPWSTKGPNFVNRNLLTGAPRCSVPTDKDPDCTLSFCTMPYLFLQSESTTARKPWFYLSTNGHKPAPSSQNYTSCILVYMYSDQSELHNLNTSFIQKGPN